LAVFVSVENPRQIARIVLDQHWLGGSASQWT
jgi:hypothetical protein